MATLTDPTAGEGKDRAAGRLIRIRHLARAKIVDGSGRLIRGAMVSRSLCYWRNFRGSRIKAVVERQNEMEKMISRRTRERQHSFLRQGNQSQYDFTDTVRGQVQDALERSGTREFRIKRRPFFRYRKPLKCWSAG